MREIRTYKRSLGEIRKEIEAMLANESLSVDAIGKLESLYEDHFLPTTRKFDDAMVKWCALMDDGKKDDKEEEARLLGIQKDLRHFSTNTIAKVRTLKKRALALEAPRVSQAPVNEGIKLKSIELPVFDGDLCNFYNFKSLFLNLVHEKTEYSNVQKLYYLKQALTGKAAVVLRDCELNDEAYNEAWAYFLERYESKRAIVRNLFCKLGKLQPIRDETGIRELADEVKAVIRGLKVAGEEVNDSFSRYITYLVTSKLDPVTAKDWENYTCSDETYPTFGKLFKFLQGRSFVVEEKIKEKTKEAKRETGTTTKRSFSTQKPVCVLCKQAHWLNQCDKFRKLKPQRRYDVVKENKMCLICFSVEHNANECINPKFKCRCGKPHNYMLHFEFKEQDNEKSEHKSSKDDNDSDSSKKQTKTSFACQSIGVKKLVVLPSAVARFWCGKVCGKVRILFDSCSQATMVSDAFVRKFRLPVSRAEQGTTLAGVGGGVISNRTLKLFIGSRHDTFEIEIETDVVPASSLQYNVSAEIDSETVAKLRKFNLADPAFAKNHIRVSNVDMILGAEYYELCICNNSDRVGGIQLRLSKFGWTISGPFPASEKRLKVFSGCTIDKVENSIRKFWEIENSEKMESSLNEDWCNTHFERFHRIAKDGKFVVKLPLKVNRSLVNDNRALALKSLYRLEATTDSKVKKAYAEFMREYIEMGHASLAEAGEKPAYFIPHRAVERPQSSTTPVRVVFNASSKQKGQISLNEALVMGPKLQRELFDILVSVRGFEFMITADIEKMYRMIWVDERDRNMQKILWRESSDDDVREYRLNTVTYGTVPASFLATKCLAVIADRLQETEPLAAKIIRENFYMDDLIAGGDTVQEVRSFSKIIHDVLLKYGFRLRKYSSNSNEVLNELSSELLAKTLAQPRIESEVAILGVAWHPESDVFRIKLNTQEIETTQTVTKRMILSYISRTFDPLGLIAPIVLRGKLLMQELWKLGVTWDTSVPVDINRIFCEYISDLQKLRTFEIPRCYRKKGVESMLQIVGFSDASSKAYSAVIYVRSLVEGKVVSCTLCCAKTRVAPVKALTIPKLELMGAMLLSQLVDRVRKILNISLENCFLFTDSTIVLCWLSRPPDEWKVFVANRVEKIRVLNSYESWFYVNSRNNPADLATRGLSASELIESEWVSGPAFVLDFDLKSDPIPNSDVRYALERRKETSKISASFSTTVDEFWLDRFSSYTRLIRSFAYVNRFLKNARKAEIFAECNLALAEIESATVTVIRLVQRYYFSVDIDRLKANKALKADSKIRSLTPFLDSNQILRVGGRLENATISHAKMHPIIIHAKAKFTRLLVRWIHEKHFHAGRKFVVAYLAARYWIVGGSLNVVKHVIRQCVRCSRYKAETYSQMMGQLPEFRVNVSDPFAHTGVDIAGPFQTKCVAHRAVKFYKTYIAVFVCMTVKCVHIELVTDLSTAKFIEALQRFIARRGLPKRIYSDNGSNFVGARNFFEDNRASIQSYARAEQFDWQMSPPRSPHFGGIWEAAVKSAKFHLMRVTNGVVFAYDEYYTLFTKIEAILNSRPLCVDSADPTRIITPGHFLIGRSIGVAAHGDDIPNKPLNRRLIELEKRTRSFWSCWRSDYLNQLQRRNKWQKVEPNIKVGEVVLLKEDSAPQCWPLGVVVRTYPGKDAQVRVVDVKARGSIFKRAITKLVRLPINSER